LLPYRPEVRQSRCQSPRPPRRSLAAATPAIGGDAGSPDVVCYADYADREDGMLARILPAVMVVAVVAICLSDGAFAHGGRPHTTSGASSRTANPGKAGLRSTGRKQRTIRALAADPYADPAAPYKANHLSSRPGESIVNFPSQTTVLTRQVLDDKNATTVRDALRTTPGVTVGR